jgi:phospholipase C
MARRSAMAARTAAIGLLLVAGLGLGGMLVIGPTSASDGALQAPRARAVGILKIRHVVIIMQENRSFDSYFGTYRWRKATSTRTDGEL